MSTTRRIIDVQPAEFAALFQKHHMHPEAHAFEAKVGERGVCPLGIWLVEVGAKWSDGGGAQPIEQLLPQFTGKLMTFATGFDAGFLDSAPVKARLQAEECAPEFKHGFECGQVLRTMHQAGQFP